MESWLVKKKLNEAYNITQLRDVKRQEQIEQEARDQLNNNNNVKNYKMWVTDPAVDARQVLSDGKSPNDPNAS